MRTDDFLADLGAQLSTARPRRDLRPALAVTAVALLAVVLLALVPRGDQERDRPAPAVPAPVSTPKPLVGIYNGTLVPKLASRVAKRLRERGYRTLPVLNAAELDRKETTVVPTAPRFAAAADELRRRLGATGDRIRDNRKAYTALMPGAEVLVILGPDVARP